MTGDRGWFGAFRPSSSQNWIICPEPGLRQKFRRLIGHESARKLTKEMQVAVNQDGDGHSASAGCETGLSLFSLDTEGAKVRTSLRRQEAMQGRPSPRRLPNRGAVGRVPVGTARGDDHYQGLPRLVWRMQAAVLRCQRAGRAESWFRWAKIRALPGGATVVAGIGSAPIHF